MKSKDNSLFIIFFVICYISSNFAVIISKVGVSQEYSTLIRYIFLIISLVLMGFSTLILSFKEKVFITITIFSCVITLLLSHSTWSILLLTCVFLVLYSSRIKIADLSKIILYSNIVLLIMTLFFLFFSDVWGSLDARYGVRETYGFTSPNIPSMYLLSIYISAVFYLVQVIRNKPVLILSSTILFILFYFLINPTVSRTSLGFLIISYLSVFLSLFTDWNKYRKIYSHLCMFFILTVAISQLYLAFNYNSSMSWINIILSNRIGLSHMLYEAVGMPKIIAGIDIEPYTPLDFFFIAYFYSTGWIFGLFFFYIFLRKIKCTPLNFSMVGIILSCLLSTITERQFLIPLCSIALFIVYSKIEYKIKL